MTGKRLLLFVYTLLISVLISSCSRNTTGPDDTWGGIFWQNTYGGDGSESGHAVQQTADGGYIIVGRTTSFGMGEDDVYLIKTDYNGNEVWSRTYGGANSDVGNYVIQTNDGGYLAAGYTYSFSAEFADIYIVRTDHLGDTIWTRTYGGDGYDKTYSIAKTSDGNYILAGCTSSFGLFGVQLMKINDNGDSLWAQIYDTDLGRFGFNCTSDGGYIIASYKYSSQTASDLCLIKTDNQGNLQWRNVYEDDGEQWGFSVKQSGDGNYIVAGIYSNAAIYDGYLAKIDSDGDSSWIKTFGGEDLDDFYCVEMASNGNYLCVGRTHSFGSGSGDVYILEIDKSGIMQNERTIGGELRDRGEFIIRTLDEEYVIVGSTNSCGSGWVDVYLIKLNLD